MKKSNLLASAIVSMMLLSGCNSGFQGNSSQGENNNEIPVSAYLPTFTTEEVKITFWHTMGDNLQTALNEIIVVI